MHLARSIVLCLAVPAACGAADLRPLRFEELAKMRRVGGIAVSPDGRQIVFEDWLPEPLAVATWIEKSLTTSARLADSAWRSSRTAVDMILLLAGTGPRKSNDTKGVRGKPLRRAG